MNFNPDLARAILLALKNHPDPHAPRELDVEASSQEELSYHVMLLAQENLIEAWDESTYGEFLWWPIRLRMEGHRFLTAIQDEGPWKKIKKAAVKEFGSLAWEAIKQAVLQGIGG